MRKYFVIAVAALALAACSSGEEGASDGASVAAQISAGLNAVTSRAVDNLWNKDHIGVYVTSAGKTAYDNVEYYTSSTSAEATFTAKSTGIFFQDTQECSFTAYAPYTSAGGTVDVNTSTNNTSATQEKIDFLYAGGATANYSSPTVAFTDNTASGGADCSFHHVMARLQIVLKTSADDGFEATDIFNVEKVVLGGLKHEGTFDTKSGETAITSTTATSGWEITACNYKDDTDENTRTYTLILLPQDASTSPLPLAITLGGIDYANTTSINPKLEAGTSYTYIITVKKTGLEVESSEITGWGEGTSSSGSVTITQ